MADNNMQEHGHSSSTSSSHINNNELTQNEDDTFRKIGSKLQNYVKGIWTKKTLETRLPITKWLPSYTWNTLISDMLAGLTVGLTAIPQGIAYAVVAGLEPQYGLYSGFMGCFVYLFLGSCKDVTIGPTAIMALMTQDAVSTFGSDAGVLLCFLSGCVIFLLGILHLGFIVDFISIPVVIGFTTASAITIACSQLKPLLGIKGKSNEFLQTWEEVFDKIEETRFQDLSLGLITIFGLIIVKVANDKIQAKYRNTTNRRTKMLIESFRIFNLARNAVAVIAGTLLAYIFSLSNSEPFVLIGAITGGMPPFQLPPFSTVKDNVTYSFTDITNSMGTSIISVPLIAVLESVAIAKAFAKGKTLDATQEMIALGMSNLAGSLVRSMPVTGSFTRTAVNHASGVRTPLGGIFTGALVLAALTLTSTFYFIPKATLAGVIIAAMFYMIEYQEVQVIWRTNKLDIIPWLATILGCLFLGLDYGILLGIVINLFYVLYNVARPKMTKEEQNIQDQHVMLVRPEQSIIYPAAEYMRETIMKTCETMDKDNDPLLVIDGRNMHRIDTTVAKNIRTLTRDLNLIEQDVVFWNWNENPRKACLGLDSNLSKYFSEKESMGELLASKREKN